MIFKDVIIIGAGAAGLMCAIEAGKRGRSVLIIEHAEAVGKKIRISGGGRCNFTNTGATYHNYISNNEHFIKSALAQYMPDNFINLVEKHKIPYHEKTLGQLFCDGSSKEIIAMLERECRDAGVEILLNCTAEKVLKNSEEFEIETSHGFFKSASLVVACGGLSIPKMGATDFGFQVARQFGLKIKETLPALVPLTFHENYSKKFGTLSGISADAIVSFKNFSFRENILFTHRGLSGPAILQISSYWVSDRNLPIEINLLPNVDVEQFLKEHSRSKAELSTILQQYFPKRFVQVWCEEFTKSKPMIQYSPKEFLKIVEELTSWKVLPNGTEGFLKAEVTVGGVDTNELSSKTMEAKKVPGLYFIGEVVDVTGWLGGYNFQWAWASGFVAGQFV